MDRTKNLIPFAKGDPRINRGGRPKKKHVSDAMLAELKRKPPNEQRTYAQLIAATAVKEAMHGDSTWGRIVLEYTEGKPVQPVEIDLSAEAERLAAAYGVDPLKVIRIYEQLAG